MASEKACVLDLGTEKNLFWLMDNNNPIHLRYTATLDHEIDSEILAEAWEKTKRVYPIIDCVPSTADGNIKYYADDSRTSKPIRSKNPITPGSEEARGRVISTTYDGNRVSVSAYHSLVDGGGLTMIFRTYLYFYLALFTGEEDDNPSVETREGRVLDDYYCVLGGADFENFENQALVTYPFNSEYFTDEKIAQMEDGTIPMGSIRFSSEEFIKLSKSRGGNPSSLLCVALARAAYRLHPEERRGVAFSFTLSARQALHHEDCISNCLSMALAYTDYEGVQEEKVSETASHIRELMNYQRQADYIKTMGEFCKTYAWQQVDQYALITYMGRLDIGKNTSHIVDFEMPTNAHMNCYMMDLNGEFIVLLQFGQATDEYLQALSEVITEMGVPARVHAAAHPVDLDSDTPTV
ncbi:MAG: hypothetical protein J5819_03180 [Eubacterium sp.]|nr:hypothetical protein [Eubacterium sp.]